MLDLRGCSKSATLTHVGHFLTSCWSFWECLKSATLTHFWHFLTSCWTSGNAGKAQPSHTSCTFWHRVGPLGMLEKCNTHTRWALFDIMLDFWECWKSATLTHFAGSTILDPRSACVEAGKGVLACGETRGNGVGSWRS